LTKQAHDSTKSLDTPSNATTQRIFDMKQQQEMDTGLQCGQWRRLDATRIPHSNIN
jgi:hypothetical protein